MNIFFCLPEKTVTIFLNSMPLFCFPYNSLHRKGQLPISHISGSTSALLTILGTSRKWQPQFYSQLCSLYASSSHSVSLKGVVSGVGEDWHTDKSNRHNSGVNTHSSVVLMAAFCWRGDWIRLGADCSAHWLMLPAALQCVTESCSWMPMRHHAQEQYEHEHILADACQLLVEFTLKRSPEHVVAQGEANTDVLTSCDAQKDESWWLKCALDLQATYKHTN